MQDQRKGLPADNLYCLLPGRHPIPGDPPPLMAAWDFENPHPRFFEDAPLDKVVDDLEDGDVFNLVVTGMTPALTWVLGYLERNTSLKVVLWHYDGQKDHYWSEVAPTWWAYEHGFYDGAHFAKEQILTIEKGGNPPNELRGRWVDWPEECFKDFIGGEEAEEETAPKKGWQAVLQRLKAQGNPLKRLSGRWADWPEECFKGLMGGEEAEEEAAPQEGWEAVRSRLEALGYSVGEIHEGLALVMKDGKYGFVDPDGTVVVPIQYDYAAYFSEGRAAVELNGKWGYVDRDGREAVSLQYDPAWPFYEGRAMVMKDGKYGYIDTSGTEVVPLIYNDAWPFHGGLALVKLDGKVFGIDKYGNRIWKEGSDE